MKVILIFHQEFFVKFRKKFERYKRNKNDNKLLSSIIETIKITEIIKVIKVIKMSELRMIIARIWEYRNKSIRNELIIRW